VLKEARTIGVFQLESRGMKTCCCGQARPLRDIIALVALYRPGPMDLIPDFIERSTAASASTTGPAPHAHPRPDLRIMVYRSR